MPESTTAEIIQFPARPNAPELADPAAPAKAEPTEAEARLRRALISLNEAVTSQRAAVTAWRASLGDLSTATGRLGASLRGYQDSLGKLDTHVATLRTEAGKLEAWADNALAKEG
jgi:hypothetical protein